MENNFQKVKSYFGGVVPFEIAKELQSMEYDGIYQHVYDELGFIQNEKEMNEYNLPKISAPSIDEVFGWFRYKYKIYSAVLPFRENENDLIIFYYVYCEDDGIYPVLLNDCDLNASDLNFETYDEAEFACLNKLIEIIKNK